MKKTTKNTKAAKNTTAAEDPAKTPATKMQMNRLILANLSQELKAKAEDPAESVNRLLLAHYAAQLGSKVFDTFQGWQKRGRAVKRDEHACRVWKPAEDGGKSRWLVEFLFAETQTTERAPAPAPANA